MTNNKIDAALDSVVKASGSGLQYYTAQKALDDMREAMRKIMNDRYISGWNDGNSDARDNVVLND